MGAEDGDVANAVVEEVKEMALAPAKFVDLPSLGSVSQVGSKALRMEAGVSDSVHHRRSAANVARGRTRLPPLMWSTLGASGPALDSGDGCRLPRASSAEREWEGLSVASCWHVVSTLEREVMRGRKAGPSGSVLAQKCTAESSMKLEASRSDSVCCTRCQKRASTAAESETEPPSISTGMPWVWNT